MHYHKERSRKNRSEENRLLLLVYCRRYGCHTVLELKDRFEKMSKPKLFWKIYKELEKAFGDMMRSVDLGKRVYEYSTTSSTLVLQT